jgi:hypothetical protein
MGQIWKSLAGRSCKREDKPVYQRQSSFPNLLGSCSGIASFSENGTGHRRHKACLWPDPLPAISSQTEALLAHSGDTVTQEVVVRVSTALYATPQQFARHNHYGQTSVPKPGPTRLLHISSGRSQQSWHMRSSTARRMLQQGVNSPADLAVSFVPLILATR